MHASAFVGRVGGLAVFLGIGVACGGGVGTAWASPADSSAATESAENATSVRSQATASLRSDAARSGRVGARSERAVDDGNGVRGARPAAGATAPTVAQPVANGSGTAPALAVSAPAAAPDVLRASVGLELNVSGRLDPTALVIASAAAGPEVWGARQASVVPASAKGVIETVPALPPKTDPLAPPVSAVSWTMAAAARREITHAEAIPGPAASVTAGQVVMPAASEPAVIATISVGASPIGVAVSPNGNRAYVTNSASDTVSVIDTTANTVIKTIGVGKAPRGVAVSPNGSLAYVTNSASGSVSVIDTAANTVIRTIGVGDAPAGVAVSPNGSRAYVTNGSSDSVSVIDTAANTVIQTIGVGDNPWGVAVSPNGSRAYVTNSWSGSVSVIDTTANAVIQTIAVVDDPRGLTVSPNGSRAYVTNSTSGSVSVIDTAANTVIKTIGGVGDSPWGVAVSPNGSRAYVINSWSGSMAVIDTAANTVIQTIAPPMGTTRTIPRGLAVSPNGSRLYVTNSNSDTVSVIDTGVTGGGDTGGGETGGGDTGGGETPSVSIPGGYKVTSCADFSCATGGYSSTYYGWPDDRYGPRGIGDPLSVHNCTRYAAFKLQQNGLTNDPGLWGFAKDWDTGTNTTPAAPGVHDTTPVVGAIAWWGANQGLAADWGHVGYVEAVGTDTAGKRYIEVTWDNYRFANDPYVDLKTERAFIEEGHPYWPTKFLHIDTGQGAPPRVNTAPVVSKPSVGTPAAGTGVVTGKVNATDPEGDTMTYSAPASTMKGTVSINAATGSFTYTPTATARQNAGKSGATEADKSDSFTATVSDGQGGSTQVMVEVGISAVTPPVGGNGGFFQAIFGGIQAFFQSIVNALAALFGIRPAAASVAPPPAATALITTAPRRPGPD